MRVTETSLPERAMQDARTGGDPQHHGPDPARWSLRRMLAAIATVAGGTVILKVLGFARDAGLAARFGLGPELDAYNMAQILPVLVSGLLVGEGGGRLSVLFVPLFTEVRARSGMKEAWRLTLTVFNLCVLVLAVVTALAMLFPETTVRLFAPGFEGARAAIASQLVFILAASTIAMGVTGFLRGYLLAHSRFTLVTAAPALASIGLVVYVFTVAPRHGIAGVAWVTLAAAAIPVLLQFPLFLRHGGTYRPSLYPRDPAVGRLGRLFLPVMFGMGVTQLSVVVDQVMASMLPAGNVTALTYANRLRAVPFALFIQATTHATFPRMCAEYTARGLSGLRDMALFAMRVTTALTVPAATGLLVLREPLARLTFGHGAVDEAGITLIAGTMGFYVLGLFPLCLGAVLGTVFYALQDTRTPTLLAIVALVTNIVGNLLLAGPMQANGLALATSISAGVYFVSCALVLRGRVPGLGGRMLLGMYGRAVAASAVMAAACLAFMTWGWRADDAALPVKHQLARVTAILAVGLATYIAAALAFRVEGARLAWDLVRKRRSS